MNSTEKGIYWSSETPVIISPNASDVSPFFLYLVLSRMGSVGVQIVCLSLGVLGLIGAIVCCVVPRWKVSSFTGSNIVTAQVMGETSTSCYECFLKNKNKKKMWGYESHILRPTHTPLQCTDSISGYHRKWWFIYFNKKHNYIKLSPN